LDGDQVPNEIIIIDQSQERHSLLSEMRPYRGCEIRYCWSQSTGTSIGRNIAIRMARYENLVIIDDDVFVSPDWLPTLIRGMINNKPKCVVSGQVLASKTSEGGFAPSTKTAVQPEMHEGRVWKDVLWSNNMALPRSAVEDVGFFDERLGPGTAFPAAEDNDYGFRLLEADYRIHYIPAAIVFHRDWRPKKDYLQLRWKYGVGRGGFYAKYFSLRDRYNFHRMLADLRVHLISSLYKIRHDPLKAYGDLVLAVGILVGAGCWLVRYRFNDESRAIR
jgi:GT2 family glycosyltransferase